MKYGHTASLVEIDGTVLSLDVLEKKFVCDTQKCKGRCCVHGESGAPLEDGEAEILERIYPQIKKFLSRKGIESIEALGTSVVDTDNERVTPLVSGRECAYAVFRNGIARCGIEEAFEQGATDFRKPVSCHLYPIRTKNLHEYEAVNYDRWSVCDPAREHGRELDVPVFRFVREALVRKFGEDYYDKLESVWESFVANRKP